jgi:FkbM family methyltransferase
VKRIRMAVRMVLAADDLASRRSLVSYFAGNAFSRVARRWRGHSTSGRGTKRSVVFRLGGVEWSAQASASQLGGIHDVWLADEYGAFPGFVAPRRGVVLDIGSNAGAYALWQWVGMERTGTVVAVEPSPATAQIVRENIDRNGANDAITVLELAVWSTPGTVEFTASRRTSSTTGVTATLDLDLVREGETVEVLATTLDELVSLDLIGDRAVDVVKIDIEGAELVVLAAASATTLSRINRFVIEMDDHTWQPIVDLLVESGFAYRGRQRNVGYFERSATSHAH